MQYMLLIYVDPATYAGVTDEQNQAEMAEYFAFGPSLRERGIEVSGEGLQPITTATTVRVRDGQALITDCLLYTSPSPRDRTRSRMPSSA